MVPQLPLTTDNDNKFSLSAERSRYPTKLLATTKYGWRNTAASITTAVQAELLVLTTAA